MSTKAIKKVVKLVKKVKKVAKKSGFTGHGAYKNNSRPKINPNTLMKTAMNQRQAGIRGRGDYFGDLLGGLGTKLGNFLSGKAKSFIGVGDYEDASMHIDDSKISGNSLAAGTAIPVVANKGQAFIFRHREYIGDVLPSVGFVNNSYIMNPGNSKLFPWLAPIASAFEEYQIIGMLAEYKPLVSAVSANSIGAVVFATEYNVLKPAFTSKVAMENYEYATSCAPHHAMFHAIECKPAETPTCIKDVLVGGVPSGSDARLYNWGNLQLATQGQANTTGVIGEFWLTYEIACFKPLFSVSQGLAIPTDKWGFNNTPNSTNLFNTITSNTIINGYNPKSFIGCTISTGGIVVFPLAIASGSYLINCTIKPNGNWSSNTTWQAFTNGGAVSNGAFLAVYNGPSALIAQTVGLPASAVAATADAITICGIFAVNAIGASQGQFTIPQLTTSVTNTFWFDIVITQVNGNINT